jgi:GDP/UDP-N,N'-diacetylbacillosamine 2-epimerase (hydrolysing)
MEGIRDSELLELQLVVTGAHLSPEFGLTYLDIEADGFTIDAKVEMLLSGDTRKAAGKSLGIGVIGFCDTLTALEPDMMLVLGDRYELLSSCAAALMLGIPIAHIGGGDHGSGTIDNLVRHAVTKLANFHFVTNELAHRSVIQMGENPESVVNVGALALDNVKSSVNISRQHLGMALSINPHRAWLLVNYHPLTDQSGSSEIELKELQSAVIELSDSYEIIWTGPNADPGHGTVLTEILQSAEMDENIHFFNNLGLNFLSVLSESVAVIGNSSSGIYEAPLMGTPTIDLGSRQAGRVCGSSVLRIPSSSHQIIEAVKTCQSGSLRFDDYPYGSDASAPKIVAEIENREFVQVIKEFFHVN